MSMLWMSYNGKALTSHAEYGLGFRDQYNPLDLPAYTMRFQFNDDGYNPATSSRASWKSGAVWTQVSSSPNVWDYTREDPDWSYEFTYSTHGGTWSRPYINRPALLGANTRDITNMRYMLNGIQFSGMVPFSLAGVTSIEGLFSTSILEEIMLPVFGTSHITDMSDVFRGCGFGTSSAYPNGYPLPIWDVSNVTYMSHMFKDTYSASSLAGVVIPSEWNTGNVTNMTETFENARIWNVENLDTHNVSIFNSTFRGCYSDTWPRLPHIDTTSARVVYQMFSENTTYSSGIYDMYLQLSSNPTIYTYADCFKNCGSGNASGQAELAQIPTSWGGTAT